ncbi:ras gtpase-activating protein [Moniliophthora roreri]|nr:ras gtpase-activating protein [Moniliophthora roreri]
MGEPIRSKNHRFGGFLLLPTNSHNTYTSRASLILRGYSFVNGFERLGLEENLLPQIAQMNELCGDFLLHELVTISLVNDLLLLELPKHLFHFDTFAN